MARPFTVGDIFQLRNVADPQLSPDGARVCFVVQAPDLAGNRTCTTIWLAETGAASVSAAGAPARALAAEPMGLAPMRQLTHGPSDSAPRWAPDGQSIAFSRAGQVWLLAVRGGCGGCGGGGGDHEAPAHTEQPPQPPQPRQLSQLAGGTGGAMWALNAHEWSPDGRWLACVSRGERPQREYLPTGTAESMGGAAEDMLVCERIFYKWAGGFNPSIQQDGSYTPCHIWLLDVEDGSQRQLTFGEQDDHSLSWSPASDEICFVSNRTNDWDNNGNNDLFAVGIAPPTGGKGAPPLRRVTRCPTFCFTPAWSPCGQWIALSTQQPTSKDSPAADHHVGLVPALRESTSVLDLTATQDRRVQYGAAVPLVWSADSSRIFFPAADHGTRHVFSVAPAAGSPVTQITHGPRQIAAFDCSNGVLVTAMKDEHGPCELLRFSLSSEPDDEPVREEAPLSSLNADVRRRTSTSAAQAFEFESFDGMILQGWVFRPADSTGDDKVASWPCVLQIHGGPHGMHGYTYIPQIQALAGGGYCVVIINPRGSNGYGQAFSAGCVGDWGGGDYRDLMAGLDAAIVKFPCIDPARLGVCGGSYGGFMTMFAVTQTQRFRGAVAHAGLSNLISFYGTSMYQLLCEFEFGGKPWEKHEQYWGRSPLAHVNFAKTPLLLTHGEMDMDVPITQSEEFFISLRKLGVPTSFVRYPRESHGISEPQHVQNWLVRHLAWFDQYVKGMDTPDDKGDSRL
jgi:dipeptidyl aminopeptidase/acylaminoacyl peptidase